MSIKTTSASPSMAPESPEFSKELFKPMPATKGDGERLSRPVIGYWKDATLRLLRNKVAVTALLVIAGVGLTGVVGPIFFPSAENGVSYENQQNPDLRNLEPTTGEQLIVVEDVPALPEELVKEDYPTDAPLLAADQIPAVQALKVEGRPTVNGVTLTWDAVPGVSGYQVFRGVITDPLAKLEDLVNDGESRGFQVGTVSNPAQHSYTDSAGLDPSEQYLYTVIPFVANPETLEESLGNNAAAVLTQPKKTVGLSDAQILKADVKEGEVIRGRPHWFGTDALGRDIFSRMVFGTRVDFFLALIIPTIALVVGIFYGAVSGLLGGKVDLVMMRIIEIIDSLPDLLLYVLLQVALGKGIFSLVVALSAFAWTSYARILRGEVLRLREIEFVHASRLLGSPTGKLIARHIAPNLLGVMIVLWSGHIPRVITGEAFLSLIGLGVESPMATWGTVLQEAGNRFQVAPLQFFLPASVMAATLLAFFLLGDALRDAFDPKLRGRE